MNPRERKKMKDKNIIDFNFKEIIKNMEIDPEEIFNLDEVYKALTLNLEDLEFF